jgi:hypothetical protein
MVRRMKDLVSTAAQSNAGWHDHFDTFQAATPFHHVMAIFWDAPLADQSHQHSVRPEVPNEELSWSRSSSFNRHSVPALS